MKTYEVHYVERGGFPGAWFETFEAETDKAAKHDYEYYLNQSLNRNHCGIRIFRMPEEKCILTKLKGA